MSRTIFCILAIFNCICFNSPLVAAEKMARLIEVPILKPDVGFELGNFDINNDWIAWTESGPRDTTIIGFFSARGYRSKVGSKYKELLLNVSGWRYTPEAFIASARGT